MPLTQIQEKLLTEYENIPQDDLEKRLLFLHKNENVLGYIGGDLYTAWQHEAEAKLGFKKMIELEEKLS